MTGAPSGRKHEHGLAMVEFVLASPVLLLLLFGVVEFGHFMLQYSALNDSVRNASRYIAGNSLSGQSGVLMQGTQWTTRVGEGRNLAVFGNIAGSGSPLLPGLAVGQITITQDVANSYISVSAAYPYQSLFGATMPDFMGGRINTTFTLNIFTSMRAT